MPNHRNMIPGFAPIAPSIWSYTPSPTSSYQLSTSSPTLIILFSWTGAQGRHISRYTSTYQTLFPTTPIMVITTTAKDLCFRSPARKQARLRPAVARIQFHFTPRNAAAGILMHVFSEGGSNKAVELAEAYHAATNTRLPCAALSLDSTPGHPRYLRLCAALGKSLPPCPVVHGVGLVLGSAVLGGIWGLYCCVVGYSNNVITQTRRRIVDAAHWDLAAPRCYLYSRADALIAWRDVREHVVESAGLGVPLLDVCFEGSAHCRHAALEPERYWGSVMWTWKRAAAGEMGGEKAYLVDVDVDSLTWADSDSGSEKTL